MGVRGIVFCAAVTGLVLVGLSLVGIVTTWGLDWVTIESEEPASESAAEPAATETPQPEAVATGDAEADSRYQAGTAWTVIDVPSALNVRNGPSTDHQILGTANLGSTVTLTGEVVESPTSGTWVQIHGTTVSGWVFATYLTPAS